MLNPLWLKTFCRLADLGHFTRTAEALHMTQPGVSQHIKKLELACGYSLLKREGKSVALTEQGRLVYDYALRQTAHEIELVEALNFDDPHKGVCRFACSGALALKLYPELLQVQQKHSGFVTHLEAAPNHKILEDLQRGAIDLAIVTHKPTPSLYHFEIIGEEPLCLVLPKAYRDQPITPETLCQLGLVRHPDAHHYLSLYFDHCANNTLKIMNVEAIPSATYINQLSQILLPVAQGIGFTVLPKSAIDLFSQPEQLHIHTPAEAVVEQLYLVQKRGRDLPARYTTLSKQLIASFNHNG